MKTLRHIRILVLMLVMPAAVSCYYEHQSQATLTVQLVLDDESVDIDFERIEVRLQNKQADFNYSSGCDAQGRAVFTVSPGKYDVMASAWFPDTRIAVNGASEEFLLLEDGVVDATGAYGAPVIEVRLRVAIPNPLIIREFYYHGSTTLEGANYTKDTYVELYNNAGPGGQTVYLDSLCLAAIYPYNSTTGNNAWAGLDTIPVAQMYWMFPGDGHTYPLGPGESVVIACNAAVDHTGRATSGLKLNKAHFGCWSELLPRHEISAGVVPMVLTMTGQGNAWALSIHSPALVVFRPSMGVAAWQGQPDVWEYFEPGRSSGTKYWHIASEWILDGVECVDAPSGAIKRLPPSIDASYVWMRSGHYSGKCVSRVLDFVSEGIEVYKDTNNSDEDFMPDCIPSPRLKP
ncbi:MAG: DUF4876 domain-containing protein [Bacteroidales bacterium]|nr:DUF4876 domain-containing protein [Bacteroidales bacterium]